METNKKLRMSLTSGDDWDGRLKTLVLGPDEYPYLYLKREVTKAEVDEAINTIITYFQQTGMVNLVIDLDQREAYYRKGYTVEMTLDELEKQLGYKIKLVNKDDKRRS